jgi:rhomboid protease GluP
LPAPQGGELPLSYEWQRRLERWKSALGFSGDGGSSNQPRPQICPACGALVGINATKCYQCGTNLRFSAAALSKKFSRIFGDHAAPVTTALLIANLLMFGISWMTLAAAGKGGGLAILWGIGLEAQYPLGMSLPMQFLLVNGEWWRLVTAMFLHGGLIHIGFNMMVLMQFGPAIEELYGSGRYLFLYTVTGAFGFLVSSFFSSLSLGASGALLGLLGAILAITGKRGGTYMRELRSRLIGSLVFLFALGLMPGIGMDNWAHAGGLVSGLILGKIFADHPPMSASERRNAALLGGLAGLAILASFAFMILHYRDPIPGQGQ